MALGVAIAGTALHDPDDGASLWLAGEVFLAIQASLCWAAAPGLSR